ncbi:MAG: hypothetical protein K9W44_05805 [Candidatus Lokiarchaeota archaeon]|nr:hypothetical protein [Candidatus Harpocratesius repetitus]
MEYQSKHPRYLLNTIHSRSLETNPLKSPVNRIVSVYLPPDYYQNFDNHYPVVYVLHGYDGHAGNWLLMPDLDLISWQPIKILMKSIGNGLHIDKVPTYIHIDKMIKHHKLPPMIIVQPDASLHLRVKGGLKGLDGARSTKGSFYVNSPFSGNYANYISQDIIKYIDSHFRTIPDREHRVLIGGSMGGFGALYLGHKFSNLFSAFAALSPANTLLELLQWDLVVPLISRLLGHRLAQKFGKMMFEDILETQDMIFSGNRPLLPSLKFDSKGNLISYDEQAWKNWQKYDLLRIFEENPENLRSMKIWLSCDSHDEYGLFSFAQNMHDLLKEKDIPHYFSLEHDPRTELSPHIFGIAFEFLNALQYCTQDFL